MSWLDDVQTLMPPPDRPRAVDAQAWSADEAVLGTRVPSDYKAFVATYGSGGIYDFIWFFVPASGNETLNLASAAKAADDAYAQLRLGSPAQFPLPSLPEPGSLLSFAVTDNGNYLGWIVDGPDPDQWRVAIMDDEAGVPEVTGMTFGPFLTAIVRQEFKPRYFPDGVFRQPARFEVAP